MTDNSRIELSAAVISLFLFISSEVLSWSKCDANGITDLLTRALQALRTRGLAQAQDTDTITV